MLVSNDRGDLDPISMRNRRSFDAMSVMSVIPRSSMSDESMEGLSQVLDAQYDVPFEEMQLHWDWRGETYYAQFIKSTSTYRGTNGKLIKMYKLYHGKPIKIPRQLNGSRWQMWKGQFLAKAM
jgi:hypothetical protein